MTTNILYDKYRRRFRLYDPSSGTISYTYDDEGNMVKETNANKETIENTFDEHNRLIKKTCNEFETSYTYNEYGDISEVTSDNGTSTVYIYDEIGCLSTTKEYADAYIWLQKDFEYSNGNIESIHYTAATGLDVTEQYVYSNGHCTTRRIKKTPTTSFSLKAENDFGMPTKITTGQFTREYNYDHYGLPTRRLAYHISDSDTIQDFSYNFDANTGNLISRTDNRHGQTENFEYDDLNRLIAHSDNSISYDNKGNIMQKSDVGEFEYSLTQKPYAISDALLYDCAIPSETQNIVYTSFNRPDSISENGYTASFVYNDEYDRVRMVIKNADNKIISDKYYLGGCYEYDKQKSSERFFIFGDYYSAPIVRVNNTAVMLYIDTSFKNDLYIFKDYLGNITNVVPFNGRNQMEFSYDPWGRLRDPEDLSLYENDDIPALPFDRGFTGHEHLNQFGLINMNARLYDPAIGRFLSPDPHIQMPEFSQNFNRYSYALNNPLTYNDESGKIFLFSFINAAKDLFVNSFIKVWTQGFNAWSNGNNWHSTKMAFKIDMGLFKGNFKQVASRFFWELPQTTLGHFIGSVQNTFYGVKNVTYYGGATAIESYSKNWGAFTLGSFIYGARGLVASPTNATFQHEYGHYLQSQASGPFYLQRYGIPSLIDAAGGSDHRLHRVEQDANIRAFRYFAKNVPNFIQNGNNPNFNNNWNATSNPIIGFDWTKPYSNSENQQALKNGLLSLSWTDYLFGPNILLSGIFNSIDFKY